MGVNEKWWEDLRREHESNPGSNITFSFAQLASLTTHILVPGFIKEEPEEFEGTLKTVKNAFDRVEPGFGDKMWQHLPELKRLMDLDVQAAFENDPASQSRLEIIAAYPGFKTIAQYRIAHVVWNLGQKLAARLLTEQAHGKYGIDIHPAAKIGESFFIDHGTGVVIGETTEIGNNVTIYQGVTLGALHVKKSLANTKRHPTVEDNVVIYSNATILGGETVIGRDSIIGANAWITQSVPPDSFVGRHSEVRPKRPEE